MSSREAEDEAWLVAQKQAAVDREYDLQYDPRERDEYDPNADAFDREIESRIARERENKLSITDPQDDPWTGPWGYGCSLPFASHKSEPPSVARSAGDTPQGHCPLCAVDRSLKAHVAAFTHAVDSLEAVVQRLRRFLMVEGKEGGE